MEKLSMDVTLFRFICMQIDLEHCTVVVGLVSLLSDGYSVDPPSM